MIYPVCVFGNDILRTHCVDVQEGTDMKQLVDDMFETMYHAEGVGLAAPQIGKNIKVLVIDFGDYVGKDREKKVAMINPVLTIDESSNFVEDEEGCLSIPGIYKKVLRKNKITVKYFDVNWLEHEAIYEGFAARIVQHEYDHLCGKLFIDYLETASISRELKNIKSGDVQTKYQIAQNNFSSSNAQVHTDSHRQKTPMFEKVMQQSFKSPQKFNRKTLFSNKSGG